MIHHHTGRRNKFATPCVECHRVTPPGGGYLLPKREGQRWYVWCDDCRRGSNASYRTPPPREEALPPIDDDPIIQQLRRLYEARLRQLREEAAIPPCLRALGLKPPVTTDDIKRAYRAKSLVCHPDAGGSNEAFITLQRNYEAAMSLATCGSGRVA